MGLWSAVKSTLEARPPQRSISSGLEAMWCVPAASGTFQKLGVHGTYNLGKSTEYPLFRDDGSGRIDAAWGIIANSAMLTKHFPWVKETFEQIRLACGTNVFSGSAPAAAVHLALDIMTKDAFTNGFVYVVKASVDTAYIGADEIVFGELLFQELSGKMHFRPENIRFEEPFSHGILVDRRGSRGPRLPLSHLLCGVPCEEDSEVAVPDRQRTFSGDDSKYMGVWNAPPPLASQLSPREEPAHAESTIERMRVLKQLLDEELISPSEFETRRAAILAAT